MEPRGAADRNESAFEPALSFDREVVPDTSSIAAAAPRPSATRSTAPLPVTSPRPISPFSQALVPSDSTRGRRAQDDFDYQQSQGFPERERRGVPETGGDSVIPTARPGYVADPAGPAWLYAPSAPVTPQKPMAFQAPPPQSSVADTLQHSRERVAARWFALKGVFEQPGQDPEVAPVRQKETRTPVLAVFSLAGGVGKTSLVATVGRSLSSMGEKVLLTDTTSHGLLPFYFGASELRQGTVRTFSPPSGSTDAPIYLVSYDVDQTGGNDEAQEQIAEEIINNSRGTHRILLDLTPSTSWVVRRMFRMNPTILVPLAPDMNSVISLQTLEKFFHGINDGDGHPLQPFYVLNQFDTSLPLHLDVREVLRRQLGDRLLPFVIRRAPSVSEALAEGMTVVDYAPDAPVTEDYLNVATWLRTVAAPATAGFRNVRWSER
jgi:cellulose synthase operon protein YhjQ